MLQKYKYFMITFLVLLINSNYVLAQKNKDQKNPFEMVIFNLGRNKFNTIKTSRDISGMPNRYADASNNIYELSVEVPFYKDYVALGFQFDMISSRNTEVLPNVIGSAYTLLVKFRLPMQFKFGNIALTNTYRAGLTSLLIHTINHKMERDKFGTTLIPSIGIDYFPIRWFGIYCEYSWRYANIFKSTVKEYNGNIAKEVSKPYSCSTSGFSLGIKFTF